MDNDQKKPAKGMKIAPDVSNDQLGENADLEFAEEYDNKAGEKTKAKEKNNQ